MNDHKGVLRIPEDLDKLESESDKILFIEVIAVMEGKLNGQWIHLFKQQCCRKWIEVNTGREANYQLAVLSGKKKERTLSRMH